MRICEITNGITEARKTKKDLAPQGPKDHVIIRNGFALEPFLYSREQAQNMAGSRDVVLPIKQAVDVYGKDPYIGWDLVKMWSTVNEGMTNLKFLKPGELTGSYTRQQMLDMGFKISVNGSWYIPYSKWRALVASGKIK